MVTVFKWIYELKAKLQEKLSEKGQGMTEYAIILAVVAIVAVAVFYGNSENAGLRDTVAKSYKAANDQIDVITSNANQTINTTGNTGGNGNTGGTP